MSASLSAEQFTTYYHGTDKDSAKNILRDGITRDLYVHPHPSISEDYGTHILQIEVPYWYWV